MRPVTKNDNTAIDFLFFIQIASAVGLIYPASVCATAFEKTWESLAGVEKDF